jgi:hypothetical protein
LVVGCLHCEKSNKNSYHPVQKGERRHQWAEQMPVLVGK